VGYHERDPYLYPLLIVHRLRKPNGIVRRALDRQPGRSRPGRRDVSCERATCPIPIAILLIITLIIVVIISSSSGGLKECGSG
jgi:hypothetical protein